MKSVVRSRPGDPPRPLYGLIACKETGIFSDEECVIACDLNTVPAVLHTTGLASSSYVVDLSTLVITPVTSVTVEDDQGGTLVRFGFPALGFSSSLWFVVSAWDPSVRGKNGEWLSHFSVYQSV